MQMIRQGNHDETMRDAIYVMLLSDSGREDMGSRKAREMLKGILETANEQKIIPMRSRTRNWQWVAMVAVLLSALSVGSWIYKDEPLPSRMTAVDEKKPESTFFTGKQFVHLPDGSTVLLNEGSKLSYSASFGKKTRKVILSGEGYFDVGHDLSKPFQVVTGKVTTTALGTAFNVKAYPGEAEIKVTVARGRVRVGNDERTFGIISPDQQISVNTVTNDFTKTNLKAEKAEVWKSEYLILDDVSLKDAARTIGEKYHVKIMLANDDLKKCRITATFLDGENLDQVLTVVTGVVQATYIMQPGGSVRIEGKGCESSL